MGDRVIAALRLTEVTIGGTQGAVLLGPIAVDPQFAGQGYGRRLVAEALEDMKANGVRLVVLVGDELYYGRFGFRPVKPGQILLPGPVDPARVLAVELQDGALACYRGIISACPGQKTGDG
jgi:predicted N-acetyltransferase YhbS